MYSIKATLFFLILSICSTQAAQKGREIIEHYDITSYHVQELGLKDLVFEARIDNLVKLLNSKFSIGKLTDVYFKIYWVAPDIYHIEVKGMPNGFKELKVELKKLIAPRIDFVIANRVSPQVRSYALKTSFKGEKTIVRAVDKTHTRDISEMLFTFDKKGKLSEFKTSGPVGSSISKLNLKKLPWSKNKWVLDSMSVKTFFGVQVVTTDSQINYTNVFGFGFPAEVSVKTKQSLSNSSSLKKVKDARVIKTSLIFSNYEVNSGKAYKVIAKLNKKKK